MWTIEQITHEYCTGCSTCFNKCPVQAIEMKKDPEGFLYPAVNTDICIDCGMCFQSCPINHKVESKVLGCIGGYSSDKSVHLQSSSGGIFALLAQETLKINGVVYGAAFAPDKLVSHIRIDAIKELPLLQGSKYLQSRMGNVYSEVKSDLEQKKQVLFSGTPCQIAGLKSYLGHDHPLLLCTEIICHGVPSDEVFLKYLKDHWPSQKVRCISFRSKTEGSLDNRIVFEFEDGSRIEENYLENSFIKGFLKNYYTRLSCYHCQFKTAYSQADITLGDFWSIGEFHPAINKSYGVSSALIRTTKGKLAIEKIKPQMIWTPSSLDEVAVWNESLLKSPEATLFRHRFFQQWKDIPFDELLCTLLMEDVQSEQEYKTGIFPRFFTQIKRWLAE